MSEKSFSSVDSKSGVPHGGRTTEADGSTSTDASFHTVISESDTSSSADLDDSVPTSYVSRPSLPYILVREMISSFVPQPKCELRTARSSSLVDTPFTSTDHELRTARSSSVVDAPPITSANQGSGTDRPGGATQIKQFTTSSPDDTDMDGDTESTSTSGNPHISKSRQTNNPDAEEEQRTTWSSPFVFVSLGLCMNISILNIAKFPDEAIQHGGAAYLVPYFLCMLMFGLPLISLEVTLSQFTGCGSTTCWEFARICQGLGWAMNISGFLMTTANTMSTVYTLYYLVTTVTSKDLPWQFCQPDEPWNTDSCVELKDMTMTNQSIMHLSYMEFLTRFLITTDVSTGQVIYDTRPDSLYPFLNGEMILYLCISMAIVCAMCSVSTVRYGNIPHFISVIMLLLSVILLGRVAGQQGSEDGLSLWAPRWGRLKELNVWVSAFMRIYSTLRISSGSYAYMASYNKLKQNFVAGVFLVTMGTGLASVFFAVIVLMFHGAYAAILGVSLEQVSEMSTPVTLVYVAIPAVQDAQDHFSKFWTFLWFFFLFCLGLSSQVVVVKSVSQGLEGLLPASMDSRKYSYVAVCLSVVLAGVPMCTDEGFWLLFTVQINCCDVNVYLISFLTVTAVAYLYGVTNFLQDVRSMKVDTRLFGDAWRTLLCWKIYLKILLPAMLLVPMMLTAYNLISNPNLKLAARPPWLLYISWMLRAAVLLPIVVVPAVSMARDKEGGSVRERLRRLTNPTPQWGSSMKHRMQHIVMKEDYKTPEHVSENDEILNNLLYLSRTIKTH